MTVIIPAVSRYFRSGGSKYVIEKRPVYDLLRYNTFIFGTVLKQGGHISFSALRRGLLGGGYVPCINCCVQGKGIGCRRV